MFQNKIFNSVLSPRSLRLCGGLLFIFTAAARAEVKKVTYQDDLMPILRNSCLNCHNPDKKKAGLDLSTYSGVISGSDNGKVVKPGDPTGSLLMRVITHAEEPFMPQKADKLPDKDIAAFKDWIAGGAPETSDSKVAVVEKKNDLATVSATIGKPVGPPPMPTVRLSLDPVVHTSRAGALSALACSPWAPLAALGGQHQIVLYNTQTLDLIGILPFPAGQPDVIRFSRNGSLLIAGGGQAAKSGKVIVWNVASAQKVAEVGDEFDAVLCADISPDQASIAMGTPNKVLKVYDAKNGKVAWSVKKHTDWVTAAAYSPDGALLASGDRAGNLYVWESKTGRDFYTLSGHKDAITVVAFRDDGNVLASASADGTIKLWNMHDGALLKSQNAHGGGVLSLAFAHDGRIVSSGRDNVAKVWTSEAEAPKAMEALPDIALHAAITDDGTRVIAGDWTGVIRVWNIADGKRLGELTSNPAGPAQRLVAAEKLVTDLQSDYDRLARESESAKVFADKAGAEYTIARQAKGADQIDAALNQLNQANQQARQATDALAAAKNNLQQKQQQVNNLNQQKIQAGIALENAKPPQKQAATARITQIDQQLKTATDALAAAEKAIPPREDAIAKTATATKAANDAMAKALEAADLAAKPLRDRGNALRAANDGYAKAKAAQDAAGAKLTMAKSDFERLKASLAGNAPATQRVGNGRT